MSNRILKSQILQAVENQMKLNKPKCVKSTFQWLVAEGYTEQDAKEMIGAILLEEMYFILKENREFNEKQYEEKLNRLGQELVPDDAAASEEAENSLEELLDQSAYNAGSFPEKVLHKVIYKGRGNTLDFIYLE